MMNSIIRIFLGVVFLSAGIYRLFNINFGYLEMNNLYLPEFFSYFVIIFEILIGGLLLINIYVKIALRVVIVFLLGAILWAIISNFNSIIMNILEIFVFDPTPTDILLHLTYVLLVFFLLNNNLDKK